jgi:hypothetical protein
MASSFTNNLRIEEMVQGEQDNTWGDKTRDNHLKIIKGLAGVESITVAASAVTLTTANGSDGTGDQASAMVLNLGGTPGADRTIIVPNETKVYIVRNNTDNDQTVKTSAGTGVTVPVGETLVLWNDGITNGTIREINAAISGTVAQATNADQLGSVVAANYAQKAVKNTWTNPQIIQANQRTLTTNQYTPDVDTDGTIVIPKAQMTGNLTVNNPTGTPVDGQVLVFVIENGATARTVTWGTEYVFPGDVNLDLTASADIIDVFTFIYSVNVDRWLNAGSALNLPRA